VFRIQPIEFVKVVLCIYLADYLARKMKALEKGKITVFIAPAVVLGTICVLTILQPDLGSVAFMVLLASALFFLAGMRLYYAGAAAFIFMPLLYFLIIKVPYRLSRLQAYINPWNDREGSGFQIIQSLLAFALGGPHGTGLGRGMQKLFYLPSNYNDFILSMVGEELGLPGVFFVWLLYLMIFICGIRITIRQKQPFLRLYASALVFSIVVPALVHMMVATGLVPTKGLPLPFVSYGGSSMVANLSILGLLISIDRFSASSNRIKAF